jgi:rSAM/selenodomain-associated transferase 2/rSAM/selenodomain-associated transferase 1
MVFGRFPEPGKTKTRLIPALGPVGASELQRHLTVRTLSIAKKASEILGAELELQYDGGSRQRLRRWLGQGVPLYEQKTGDLGHRMYAAFLSAFERGCGRALLFGTDVSDLREEHLNQAMNALDTHDAVLGPSTDGGYWLIGLKRPVNLFQEISWSTKTVLEQTLRKAEKQRLSVFSLSPLTDIDTDDDLKNTGLFEEFSRPYISVIVPTLNEADHIASTVFYASDRDAEVIVVDGGSSDDTLAKAESAGARVDMSPKGRAVQQNHGAGIANGRILLFLHADTRLPEKYVHHVFDAMMDPRNVMGAFGFKTDMIHPFMRFVEMVANFRSKAMAMPYGDQAFFMKKSVFNHLGGFPLVPIAEDLFFVRKTRKMGRVPIVKAPVITSARRWKKLGLIRTTFINYVILAGCLLGVPPASLAPLYRIGIKKEHKL